MRGGHGLMRHVRPPWGPCRAGDAPCADGCGACCPEIAYQAARKPACRRVGRFRARLGTARCCVEETTCPMRRDAVLTILQAFVNMLLTER